MQLGQIEIEGNVDEEVLKVVEVDLEEQLADILERITRRIQRLGDQIDRHVARAEDVVEEAVDVAEAEIVTAQFDERLAELPGEAELRQDAIARQQRQILIEGRQISREVALERLEHIGQSDHAIEDHARIDQRPAGVEIRAEFRRVERIAHGDPDGFGQKVATDPAQIERDAVEIEQQHREFVRLAPILAVLDGQAVDGWIGVGPDQDGAALIVNHDTARQIEAPQ